MTTESILNHYKLKNTGCRKHIVGTLLATGHQALSEQEIKQEVPDLFDRVTFYRSLRTLEEHGVIHRVALHDNCVKYALSTGSHTAQHAHFHCHHCHQVLCLQPQPKPTVLLPEGYAAQHTQVVVEGVCAQCGEGKPLS